MLWNSTDPVCSVWISFYLFYGLHLSSSHQINDKKKNKLRQGGKEGMRKSEESVVIEEIYWLYPGRYEKLK